jgi:hypothetical protein
MYFIFNEAASFAFYVPLALVLCCCGAYFSLRTNLFSRQMGG